MDKARLAWIGRALKAARIVSFLSPVRTQETIVPPGSCFLLEEFERGMQAPPGKVWIRHQNFSCYEIDARLLAEA